MTKYLLGDLVRNCKEKVDRDNNPYEYFVAGDHMETERPRLTMRGRFDEADVGPAFIRLFRPGQVLYGSRRTYLKKVSVADFEGVTSNVTFVLETKDEEILPQRLLPFLLLSDRFTSYSIGKSKGSTNPYVLFSDLEDFDVDLPEPAKVAEIADIVCAAEQVKENYRSLLRACDDVVKSQFVEMFHGVPEKSVSSLCSLVSDGTHQPPKFESSGIPFLLVSNINDGVISYATNKFISRETYDSLYKRTPISVGDVLLTVVGSYGKSAVIVNDEPFLFQRHIACMKPRRELIDSQFMRWALCASAAQEQIEKKVTGIAQKTLSLSSLKSVTLPLPPLELQREFAGFAASVDKSKFAVQKALDELNATTKKILNQELGLGDV